LSHQKALYADGVLGSFILITLFSLRASHPKFTGRYEDEREFY
jgi:hypothetical protein